MYSKLLPNLHSLQICVGPMLLSLSLITLSIKSIFLKQRSHIKVYQWRPQQARCILLTSLVCFSFAYLQVMNVSINPIWVRMVIFICVFYLIILLFMFRQQGLHYWKCWWYDKSKRSYR